MCARHIRTESPVAAAARGNNQKNRSVSVGLAAVESERGEGPENKGDRDERGGRGRLGWLAGCFSGQTAGRERNWLDYYERRSGTAVAPVTAAVKTVGEVYSGPAGIVHGGSPRREEAVWDRRVGEDERAGRGLDMPD